MLRDAASEAISIKGPATPLNGTEAEAAAEAEASKEPPPVRVIDLPEETEADAAFTVLSEEDDPFEDLPSEAEEAVDAAPDPEPAPAADAAPEPDPEPEPEIENQELIREIVETTQISPEEAEPEKVEAEIPDSPVTLADEGKWDDLRAPLIDETQLPALHPQDAFQEEGYYGEVVPPRELTPIERVRAREAGQIPPPPSFHDLVASRPFGAHEADAARHGYEANVPSVYPGAGPQIGTHLGGIPAGPVPPIHGVAHGTHAATGPAQIARPTEPRKWDTPEDHQMSTSGRVFWHLAIFLAVLAYPLFLVFTSPFPARDTVAHYAAMTGCTAAAYLGVGEAQEGQPGYHPHLDPNGNGIACEPDVTRRLTGNGKVTFIRPGDY